MFTTDEIILLNSRFENSTTQDILLWSVETYKDDIALTSSFQTQSLPLLHIVSQTTPQLPIFFLDTGFHFPETLAYRDQLIALLGLNVINIHPNLVSDQILLPGRTPLYHENPDLCCSIHKVEPLRLAMEPLKAWISGIRRDQTQTRKNAAVVELQANGKVKINPMLAWTGEQVRQYIIDYRLPQHPLTEKGYTSIGCAPCTRPVDPGQDERAGRWAGRDKDECGLHLSDNHYSFTQPIFTSEK